jgi:hypothetical protein
MKIRIPCLLLLSICFFSSCNSESKTEATNKNAEMASEKTASGADSFYNGWKNFPNNQEKSNVVQFEVPLDAAIVDSCLTEYRNRLGTNPPNTSQIRFTYSVGFNTTKVQEWLQDADIFNNSDELKMEFGIYSQAAIDLSKQMYPSDPARQIPQSHLNRTTVFMSPYKTGNRSIDPATGNPLPSFNLGSLHP